MNGELKKKLVIAGAISPFIFIIFFIVILITPLFVLGIIDIDDIGNNSSNSYAYEGYVSTSDNTGYWWPIGSRETTTVNGKEFATGNPSSTYLTAYFNGNDNVHNGRHSGVDISAVINTENVIATKDGKVIYPYNDSNISIGTCDYYGTKANCNSYGNYVKIEHSDGAVSLYGHMYANTITVRAGDYVKQGQVLGKSGSSGNSTGGHLHFEIRIDGIPVNPLDYINSNNSRPREINKTNRKEELVE